jgi:hypothetical protein
MSSKGVRGMTVRVAISKAGRYVGIKEDPGKG